MVIGAEVVPMWWWIVGPSLMCLLPRWCVVRLNLVRLFPRRGARLVVWFGRTVRRRGGGLLLVVVHLLWLRWLPPLRQGPRCRSVVWTHCVRR